MNLNTKLQVLAGGAAALMMSGLAISHVAAQPGPVPPENSVVAQPVAALPTPPAPPPIDPKHVVCVAKVVHHEAGNQPREGQIAVAHVIVNRVKHGFGDDVCDVANQPGQFFRLNRYHPDRSSQTWAAAVAVARDVLAGEARDWSKGALYFHANWAKPDRFFRSRKKLARLEDHDFYR